MYKGVTPPLCVQGGGDAKHLHTKTAETTGKHALPDYQHFAVRVPYNVSTGYPEIEIPNR